MPSQAALAKFAARSSPYGITRSQQEPLTDEQLDRIGWGKASRHALSDDVNMFHYYRLTKDNRITWGGGEAVRYYFNSGIGEKYMDATACYEQLAEEFFKMFPQLDDVKFTHKWGRHYRNLYTLLHGAWRGL